MQQQYQHFALVSELYLCLFYLPQRAGGYYNSLFMDEDMRPRRTLLCWFLGYFYRHWTTLHLYQMVFLENYHPT